jgi:hypothetical protein
MSLTLAAFLVGGYLLTLVIVLVFVISLGRAAKVADEQEARHRRAEALRRRRGGGPSISFPDARRAASSPRPPRNAAFGVWRAEEPVSERYTF